MRFFLRCLFGLIFSIAIQTTPLFGQPAVLILVYHRFGPARTDSMTVTTEHFEQQLEALSKNDFSVIPLANVVAWKLGKGPVPPARSVVLTFDDGHESVYRDARPIVLKRQIPVTLFIYPSCISNASYAMTWDQLSELAGTPYFTIQSHTYWHPNFKHEAKKLDEKAYATFVDTQLRRSKSALEKRFNQPIEFLAWPFGIYDSYLMGRASAAGYQAAFTIDRRVAIASDPIMAIPRCLMLDDCIGPRFQQLLDLAIRAAGR